MKNFLTQPATDRGRLPISTRGNLVEHPYSFVLHEAEMVISSDFHLVFPMPKSHINHVTMILTCSKNVLFATAESSNL